MDCVNLSYDSAAGFQSLDPVKGWEFIFQLFHTAMDQVSYVYTSVVTAHLILISKFCAFYTVSTWESFSLAAGDGFPPYILMTRCLITDRSNFSFTFTCSNKQG